MKIVGALLAATVLTACQSAGPNVQVSLDRSAYTVRKTITVASGQTAGIIFDSSLNPDCSVVPGYTHRVVIEPSNGTFIAKPTTGFPVYTALNPRSACNTKRVPGVQYSYHSNAGYVGDDTVAFDIYTADGKVIHEIITVKVM